MDPLGSTQDDSRVDPQTTLEMFCPNSLSITGHIDPRKTDVNLLFTITDCVNRMCQISSKKAFETFLFTSTTFYETFYDIFSRSQKSKFRESDLGL